VAARPHRPRPLTPVNLFGFLPFTVPQIIAIGVLPILVGITQYIQFKLNRPPRIPFSRRCSA
jgi:YidC/Oxa1 family membrane protein insertase